MRGVAAPLWVGLMSFDQLAAELQARRDAALYRQRRLLESPQQPEVVIDGQTRLAFCRMTIWGLRTILKLLPRFNKPPQNMG